MISKNIKGIVVVDFFIVFDIMFEVCGFFICFLDDNLILVFICDEWGYLSYN